MIVPQTRIGIELCASSQLIWKLAPKWSPLYGEVDDEMDVDNKSLIFMNAFASQVNSSWYVAVVALENMQSSTRVLTGFPHGIELWNGF